MNDKLKEPKNYLYGAIAIALVYVFSTWMSNIATQFAILIVLLIIFWRVSETWAFVQLINNKLKRR